MENVNVEVFEILQYVTLGLTFLLHLSGMPPCLNMLMTKSTKNIPFHIFVLTAMSCGGMVYYSLLLNMEPIFYLNLVGFLLYVFYIGSYLLIVKNKFESGVFLISALAIQLAHFIYMYYILEHEIKMESLGNFLLILNVLLVAVFAWELYLNFKFKNSKGMPLVMTISNLLCNLSWLLYGLVLNDFIIYFPNIPGLILMILKLVVTYFYSSKTKRSR